MKTMFDLWNGESWRGKLPEQAVLMTYSISTSEKAAPQPRTALDVLELNVRQLRDMVDEAASLNHKLDSVVESWRLI